MFQTYLTANSTVLGLGAHVRPADGKQNSFRRRDLHQKRAKGFEPSTSSLGIRLTTIAKPYRIQSNTKPVLELCPVCGLAPELVSGVFSDWFRHNFCHNSRHESIRRAVVNPSPPTFRTPAMAAVAKHAATPVSLSLTIPRSRMLLCKMAEDDCDDFLHAIVALHITRQVPSQFAVGLF